MTQIANTNRQTHTITVPDFLYKELLQYSKDREKPDYADTHLASELLDSVIEEINFNATDKQ